MAFWKWIRGVIGAAMLMLLCVIASARFIEWVDRPQPIRAQWPHMGTLAMVQLIVAAIGLALYMGAYYATYEMPRGIKFGTDPHYQYKVGNWTVASAFGYRFFYPAHKLDQCVRPQEGD
jgi:hypothetical protein